VAAVASRKSLDCVRITCKKFRHDVQGKEHENFGPNASRVRKCVDAKCLKRGHDDKNGGPPMVERERQVYK
jgi:hypothetical protein